MKTPRYITAALWFACAAFWPTAPLFADETTDRYGQIASAIIFHLPGFTDWPASSPMTMQPTFLVCIVGSDPISDHISSTLTGRRVHGKLAEVNRKAASEDLSSCKVVFVGTLLDSEYAVISRSLRSQPILTVSSTSDFPTMVRLHSLNNRLKLTVDLSAVRSAGLSLSAELLSLSTVVNNNIENSITTSGGNYS